MLRKAVFKRFDGLIFYPIWSIEISFEKKGVKPQAQGLKLIELVEG